MTNFNSEARATNRVEATEGLCPGPNLLGSQKGFRWAPYTLTLTHLLYSVQTYTSCIICQVCHLDSLLPACYYHRIDFIIAVHNQCNFFGCLTLKGANNTSCMQQYIVMYVFQTGRVASLVLQNQRQRNKELSADDKRTIGWIVHNLNLMNCECLQYKKRKCCTE